MAKSHERDGKKARNIGTGVRTDGWIGGPDGGGGFDPLGDIKDTIGDVYNDLSGKTAARAARNAAKTQAEAIQYGIDVQDRQFNQSRADMMPWLESGRANLATLGERMGRGDFDMPDMDLEGPAFNFNMQMDPGYQFRIAEAEKALGRMAAARGNRLSGGSLAELSDRIGDMASNEYSNAFGRQYGMWQDAYGRRQNAYTRQAANKADQFGRLSGMAGMGQQQASSLASLGQGYASNMGNMYNQMGAAQAGGIMGQANARMNSPVNQMLMQIPGSVITYKTGRE